MELWLVIVDSRHSHCSSKTRKPRLLKNKHEERVSLRRIIERIFVGIVNDVDHYLAGAAELHRTKGKSSLGAECLMHDTPGHPPMRTISSKSDIAFVSIPVI